MKGDIGKNVGTPAEGGTSVKRAVCTIVSKNYLPFARTFAETYMEHNPGEEVFMLLVDRVDGYFDPGAERFKLIELLDLGIKDIGEMLFKYNVIELNTAVKPFFLEHIFRNHGVRKLAYFDPDIMVLDKMDELWGLLDEYSIVLTPHITSPINDDKKPGELDMLLSGSFNLGFIAVKDTEDVGRFLRWWQERLRKYCFMDVYKGFHVDQNWVNLVPCMYEKVHILRDPGYNAAYWNLHERTVGSGRGGITINGRPARFFHFSGFAPGDIERISKHQTRFILKKREDLRPLFEKYRELVLKNGMAETIKWPYAFNSFDNGAKIPDIARKMYGYLTAKEAAKFGDPFKTGGRNSFFNWLNGSVDGSADKPVITRLWYELYRLRADLWSAFPDVFGKDREAFVHWCLLSVDTEAKFDRAFVPWGVDKPAPGPGAGPAKERFWEWLLSRALIPLRIFVRDQALKVIGNNRKMIDSLKRAEHRFRSRVLLTADLKEKPAPPAPALPRTAPFGVNVAGYFEGEFGVAESARSDRRALASAGIPHALNNIKAAGHGNQDDTVTEFSRDNPYMFNMVHVNADMVPAFAEERPGYFRGRYNIGHWVWELPVFPERFLPSFGFFDEIWTASSYSLDAISRVSPVPVFKLPNSVDMEGMRVPPARERFGLGEDECVFLALFDFHSVFERKNPLAAVRAFMKAFRPGDKARLVIKHINSDKHPDELKEFNSGLPGRDVRVIDRRLGREDLISLYSSCDCFVSLHRSEGFGATIAEAMAVGKPVVATGYSGNMDFMNVNNSLPVRYKLVELERDYPPYEKGNVWAEADVEHAAELMRLVFENRELREEMGRRARGYIKEHLSPEATGKIYRQRLEYIARHILSR